MTHNSDGENDDSLFFWGYPVSDIYRYICRIIGKLKTTGLFCLGWGGLILEEGTL